MVTPLDEIAHVIQTALTPAFLLAGLAALLSVFASRLDRAADQVERVSARLGEMDQEQAAHCSRQLTHLRRRTKFLDAAVLLGALGGGSACLAALLLFIGGFRNATVSESVLWAFGTALALTIGSIGAFLVEMLLSSRSLRAEVQVRQSKADARHRSSGPPLPSVRTV